MAKDEDTLRRRQQAASEWLRRHHAGLAPDAGFAVRVSDRLEGRSVGLLGWAALRALPAALALVTGLAAVAWQQGIVDPITPNNTAAVGAIADRAGESADDGFVSPTDDLLSWVLADAQGGTP